MIQRHQIQGIIEDEWRTTQAGGQTVAEMIDRIQERIEETPSTIISHYQMAPIGSRELKFTTRPGPGTTAELVRLNREIGAVFQFTGASGGPEEMDLTFTPGNGMAVALTPSREKESFSIVWGVTWMIVGALVGAALAWTVSGGPTQ